MAPWDELVLACRLKADTPEQIIETLRYMIGESAHLPSSLPDHPRFTEAQYSSEWRHFFFQNTSYFSGKPFTSLEREGNKHYTFTTRTHVRLGSDVIRQFLDWIAPYIGNSNSAKFLGYTVCDETIDHVELIYLEGGDIYYYSAQLWNNPPDIEKVKITHNQGKKT